MAVTTEPTLDASRRSSDRALPAGAVVFALAVVLHNLDHLRRGVDAVAVDVLVAGTAAVFVEVGIVAVVFRRDRAAPIAAAVVGYALAVGYVVVHFLPERPYLSDSFVSAADVSVLSWVAAGLEVAAAVALGTAGLIAARRGAGGAGPQLTWGEALRVPVVTAFAAANALILAGSILDAGM